ncbi:hypothetical protein B0H16DRAFT_1733052 [Mycena metata]|uniref:Uncharacterized protein n=1 Tax=Mycena metata TaxID=1033252 RepID=A0AAD7MSZ6_9AGAR|nr:hypothetical protein B0H16DRAFT_1733052 [Mycena metata]
MFSATPCQRQLGCNDERRSGAERGRSFGWRIAGAESGIWMRDERRKGRPAADEQGREQSWRECREWGRRPRGALPLHFNAAEQFVGNTCRNPSPPLQKRATAPDRRCSARAAMRKKHSAPYAGSAFTSLFEDPVEAVHLSVSAHVQIMTNDTCPAEHAVYVDGEETDLLEWGMSRTTTCPFDFSLAPHARLCIVLVWEDNVYTAQ